MVDLHAGQGLGARPCPAGSFRRLPWWASVDLESLPEVAARDSGLKPVSSRLAEPAGTRVHHDDSQFPGPGLCRAPSCRLDDDPPRPRSPRRDRHHHHRGPPGRHHARGTECPRIDLALLNEVTRRSAGGHISCDVYAQMKTAGESMLCRSAQVAALAGAVVLVTACSPAASAPPVAAGTACGAAFSPGIMQELRNVVAVARQAYQIPGSQ
jgi:hypothetical protein